MKISKFHLWPYIIIIWVFQKLCICSNSVSSKAARARWWLRIYLAWSWPRRGRTKKSRRYCISSKGTKMFLNCFDSENPSGILLFKSLINFGFIAKWSTKRGVRGRKWGEQRWIIRRGRRTQRGSAQAQSESPSSS